MTKECSMLVCHSKTYKYIIFFFTYTILRNSGTKCAYLFQTARKNGPVWPSKNNMVLEFCFWCYTVKAWEI